MKIGVYLHIWLYFKSCKIMRKIIHTPKLWPNHSFHFKNYWNIRKSRCTIWKPTRRSGLLKHPKTWCTNLQAKEQIQFPKSKKHGVKLSTHVKLYRHWELIPIKPYSLIQWSNRIMWRVLSRLKEKEQRLRSTHLQNVRKNRYRFSFSWYKRDLFNWLSLER